MILRIKNQFFNPSARWYYPLHWLIIVSLGLFIYGQSLRFGFVFDDEQFIVNNPYIKNWHFFNHLWSILPKTRFIGMASFAANYQLNGLNPFGYHLFNLIVLFLSVAVVWAIARQLIAITKFKCSTELPFVIAVLFLVHPGQTQAISYISQRFESLAALFYLTAVYAYLKARVTSISSQRIFLVMTVVIAAILGILTKETVITLPLILLAIEFIIFEKKTSVERIGIIIGGLVLLGYFLIKAFHSGFDMWLTPTPSESHDGDILFASNYLLTQMRVFLIFLKLLILPLNQQVDYDLAASTGLFAPVTTFLGLCVMGLILWGVVIWRKKWPLISFGLAWILITFSINLVPRANVIFEHKLYLISFGFFLSAAVAVSMIVRDKWIRNSVGLGLICLLSILSCVRNGVWHDEISLWMDAVKKAPNKQRPYDHLARTQASDKQYQEELAFLNEMIATDPEHYHALMTRGVIEFRLERYTDALADFNKAIFVKPTAYLSFYKRSLVFRRQGNTMSAMADLNQTLKLNPDFKFALLDRAMLLVKEGQANSALKDMDKALTLAPYDVEALINRAGVYVLLNQFNLALADLKEAKRLDPTRPEINNNIAYCERKLSKSQPLLDK